MSLLQHLASHDSLVINIMCLFNCMYQLLCAFTLHTLPLEIKSVIKRGYVKW